MARWVSRTALGRPAGGGGGGILEKQKIKMSKMASPAAFFHILVFCVSDPARVQGGLGWLQMGRRHGYSLMKVRTIDRWGINLGYFWLAWGVDKLGKKNQMAFVTILCGAPR